MTESENKKVNKRAPIVTVMGHVDHGKTSLLDAIAKTNVASSEAGGITQGISAFTVSVDGREITFVDTPGHEAFLSMRKRGGKIADIILLVVAGSEGVKPQTQEAIAHLKDSQAMPIVVITKMDLPEANVEKVKRQLAENGVLVEGLGGRIPVAPVSVKDEESIKKLLDLILLSTDLNDFGGSVNGILEAVVLESLMDRKKGPMALVVVRSGHLSRGQDIHTATASARIRNLLSNQGKGAANISAGGAGWVLGFNKVPKVGENLHLEKFQSEADPSATKALSTARPVPPKPENKDAANLKIVLKTESLGSLEAILESLGKIEGSQGRAEVVASGVGDINDGDIYLAKDSGATVIGFKVRVLGSAADLAKEREVEISSYDIIYTLLEDIKLGLVGILQWKKKTAKPYAQVLKIFELPSGDKAIGAVVKNGTLRLGQNVVVKREETELFKSSIKNIKVGKLSVEKVSAPNECGLLLSAKEVGDVQPDDLIMLI